MLCFPPRTRVGVHGSGALTFLVIGVVGLVVLGISLVVGDLFDGAFDALAGDVFSSAVLGAFVAATGFGGAAAQAAGAPGLVAVPVGLVAGVGFGWFAYWLTRLIRDGGSDATITIDDTIGRDGRVVTGIPADGFGVVNILVGGHTLRLNARCDQPLDPGTEVHVTSVLSPTAVTVAPVWQPLG
jgi:membrane-bound ClpP family serine protease